MFSGKVIITEFTKFIHLLELARFPPDFMIIIGQPMQTYP